MSPLHLFENDRAFLAPFGIFEPRATKKFRHQMDGESGAGLAAGSGGSEDLPSWQVDIVVRVFFGSFSVERSARGFDPARNIGGIMAGCSFEDHVLEHVRQAGFGFRFMDRADADPGLDGHERPPAILPEENPQAVG